MIMQRSRKNKHGHSPSIFHPLCIRLPSLLFFNLCPAKLPYIVTALIISTITRQRSKVQRYYLCIDNELNSSQSQSVVYPYFVICLFLSMYCSLFYDHKSYAHHGNLEPNLNQRTCSRVNSTRHRQPLFDVFLGW